jgi:hypothetical protein
MEFPTIEINFDYFLRIGQLPVHQLLGQLFLDGGWILVVWLLWVIAWSQFTAWRKSLYAQSIDYTILAATIPKDSEQTALAMEYVFTQLGSVYSVKSWWEKNILGEFTPGFSFEIVSVDGTIRFYIYTPSKYRDMVEAAIYSQYPDAEITETTDYSQLVSPPDAEWEMTGTEFTLKKPYPYPIRTYPEFQDATAEVTYKDPMAGFFEAMNTLKAGEQIWWQVLVVPADEDWKDKGVEIVAKMTGKSIKKKPHAADQLVDATMVWPKMFVEQIAGVEFSPAAPGDKKEEKAPSLTPGEKVVLERIEEKIAKVGFSCKVRVLYMARRDRFDKNRMHALKGAMHQFSSINLNSFKTVGAVTPKPGGLLNPGKELGQKRALVRNYRKRGLGGSSPYYLNTEELASIYHFPQLDVKAPLLKKTDAKRAEPPTDLPTEGRFESPRIRGREE